MPKYASRPRCVAASNCARDPNGAKANKESIPCADPGCSKKACNTPKCAGYLCAHYDREHSHAAASTSYGHSQHLGRAFIALAGDGNLQRAESMLANVRQLPFARLADAEIPNICARCKGSLGMYGYHQKADAASRGSFYCEGCADPGSMQLLRLWPDW